MWENSSITDILGEPFKKLPIMCPECGHKTAVYDDFHAETFCGQCGLLLFANPPHNNYKPALGGLSVEFAISKGNFIIEPVVEKKVLKNNSYKRIISLKKHRERRHGDKRLWRRKQYHRFVKVVNTNIRMSDYHKNRAHFIIDKIDDFRKVYYKNDYPFLVSGICLFTLEETGASPDFDNGFLKELGMNEEHYTRISSNIRAYLE